MIRTYEEALDYLRSREKFGIKFGLENIDRLAEALGRPERKYRSVLVAGTNGKGSTASLLTSILRASGLRMGRYTSPHILDISERLSVDGQDISKEALTDAVSRVARVAGAVGEPTFFEAMTACAFWYFAEREVDVAVFEVGMGGRWDATNIAPAELSVITPIGFDHEHFLGDTLEAIAAEKAAIIKVGRPVVISKLLPEAEAVVVSEAERQNATLIRASEGVSIRARPSEAGQAVELETPETHYGPITLPLLGEHQLDNLVLAVRVAEVLCPKLLVEQVRQGVAATTWPGRLQRLSGRPAFLLDAAHNIMAAEQLGWFLEAHPHPNRVLLFGVMKDKRVYEMLECLLPHVSHFVATRPEMSRARGPAPLAQWAQDRGTTSLAFDSSSGALEKARELAGPDGEIIVAGSIFLLGEVVALLGEASAAPGAAHRAERTPA